LSEELLVREARRRAGIFGNLPRLLRELAAAVREIDPRAEAYLFGSVAEGKHLLSSDIDILVVSDKDPALILAELWRHGFKDPFEIHVVTRSMLEAYRRRARLIRIG